MALDSEQLRPSLGPEATRPAGLKTHNTCKYFLLQASFDCSTNINTKEVVFILFGFSFGLVWWGFCLFVCLLFSKLSSSECSHVDSFSTNERQKRFGS